MQALVELFARVSEIERRQANQIRPGTVHAVDPAKQLVRVKLGGTEAEPFIGPWVPYSQMAGALKVHAPPTVGQQMTVLSPSGDFAQGLAVPMTWSGSNASPSSNGGENVITFGGVTIKLGGDAMTLTVGGVTYGFTGDGFRQTGGTIEHDGHKVDKSHKHTNVKAGGDRSGPPE